MFRIEPGVARWYDGMPAGLQEIDPPVPQPSKARQAGERDLRRGFGDLFAIRVPTS